MKVCPCCLLANPEDMPTCASCNAVLADVPITLAEDPDHPEHAQRDLHRRRRELTHRQVRFAIFCYTMAILITAFSAGARDIALLLYPASAVFVGVAIHRQWLGQFRAGFVQGAFAVAIMLAFGPVTPISFFMLAADIFLPTLLWIWMDLIYSNTR